MNKVPFKLSHTQLQFVVQTLEFIITNSAAHGYTTDPMDKLIVAALAELFAKLHGAYSPFKKSYSIKVARSQAMAFFIHFNAIPGDMTEDQMATIIQLTSVIQQPEN